MTIVKSSFIYHAFLLFFSFSLFACTSTGNNTITETSSGGETTVTQDTDEVSNTKQSNKFSIQGFNNVILFSLPEQWNVTEPAYQAANGQQALLEFVPDNETVEMWSEYLSLSAIASLPKEATPTSLFENMYAADDNCQGERIFEPVARGKINGFESASIIYGCSLIPNAKPTHQSELGYMIVIEGNNKDFYTIYRAIRGQSMAELSKRLNKDNYEAFMADIAPLGIQ